MVVPRLAGLHDQAGPQAQPFADEALVHGGDGEQGGNGGVPVVDAALAHSEDEAVAVLRRFGTAVAVVARMHHATIDGVSGSSLITSILDLEPAPETTSEPVTEPPAAPRARRAAAATEVSS